MLAHSDAFAALPELALDALGGSEREEVLTHVRDCLVCRRELESLRDTTAALGESLVPVAIPSESREAMRERLMGRAAASRGTKAVMAPPAADTRMRATSLRWLAAAGLIAIAGTGGILALVRSRSNAISRAEVAEQALARSESAVRERDRLVNEREAMIAALTGPAVAVVDLAASGSRDPVARMFWNRATNRWTMFGYNLPQPQPGRTYQLWLVTANERISAGTFKPGANGRALVQATYALPADALRAIAVTDEPEQGVPQPTGPIIVSGTASR